MPKPYRIKIAIIGNGWAARNRHRPAIEKHPDFILCEQGVEEADAVVIATPPSSHSQIACELIRKGKHVLIEKPVALSIMAAQEIEKEIKSAQNVCVCMAHNLLFSEGFKRMKADFENNVFGAVLSVRALHTSSDRTPKPSWYSELPHGAFDNEAAHLLYLLEALAHDGLHVQTAHASPHGLLKATMTDGVNVDFDFAFQTGAALTESHLLVMGSHACGIFDLYRDIYLRLPHDGNHSPAMVLRTSLFAFYQHAYGLLHAAIRRFAGSLDYGTIGLYSRFSSAIRSGKPDGNIGFDAGLAVAKLQEDILKFTVGLSS